MSAPEEAPLPWTPWITIVCAHQPCGQKVKRAWPPGQQPPKYCDSKCKRRAGRNRNKRTAAAREEAGEQPCQVLTVVVRCARPGCDRVSERQWHTASGEEPRYCSAYCSRRVLADAYKERRTALAVSLCEHPEKLAYQPTPPGTRRAARDAVRFEKYVYACKCFRLHLTTDPVPGVPAICLAPNLPFNDRWAAWHDYLRPIAQRLRERRWRQAA